MRAYARPAFWIAVLVSISLLGCGQQTDAVPSEWKELFEAHGIQPELEDILTQSELNQVLEEVNSQILESAALIVDPQSVRQNSAAYSAAATARKICKPSFNLVGLGVSLKFTASDQCFLEGNISVYLFPLRTKVNLKVVGQKFITGLTLQGEVALGGSRPTVLELLVQDGRIHLNLGGILPATELVISGKSSLSLGGGNTEISSRTNVFLASSKAGISLIASIKRGVVSERKVQSCFLTGGDGMNPEAGNLSVCFGLVK